MNKYRKLVFTLSSALATSQSLAVVAVVAGTNTETVSQIAVIENLGGVMTFDDPVTTTTALDTAVLQSLMIDMNGGTTLGTFDRYTAEVSGFTANLGNNNIIEVLGLGATAALPAGGGADAAFISALEATHSNGDLVNYIRVDSGANNASWNVQFDDTTGFDSSDFLIVEERDGNTTFTLTALDLSGDIITDAEILSFDGDSYQWNTGYVAADDPNSGQTQVLSVIDLSLFETTEAIGGFFVNDTGNADIKLFIGTAVPEPSSFLLSLLGLGLLARRQRG